MKIQIRFVLSSTLLAFGILVSETGAVAQNSSIDYGLALKYFREAAILCNQDHGRLWGVSLCGPMLFVDPVTHSVVTNKIDEEGRLIREGEVYVGRWPEEMPTSNSALKWAGVRWTTVQWPLPVNKYARARLMLHELFHRVQDDLGLPASSPTNNQLDSLEGRILLQLEWLALREAITHQGLGRRNAIEDALAFRARRRALFPRAATEERELEMNEGLAEYTGVRLSGRTDTEMAGYLAGRLDQAPNRTTFVRSFAYETGPAYGFLLDAANPRWRFHLKQTEDLGLILQRSLGLKLVRASVEARARSYDGDILRATETARDNARQSALKTYRLRLVDGPVLIIPLTGEINYSYDPNKLQPLGEFGMVYPTLKATDIWGAVTVTDGALMSRKGDRPAYLYLPGPADPSAQPLKGDGWKLELREGWVLERGERNGDYVVKKTAH
jgi:hypothetical protein